MRELPFLGLEGFPEEGVLFLEAPILDDIYEVNGHPYKIMEIEQHKSDSQGRTRYLCRMQVCKKEVV